MTEPNHHLWRFTPVARPDDPTWQGRRIWSQLEIVARSSGEAILLAARFDQEQAGESTRDSQDRQQVRSGFEDERLYRVDRLDAEPPPAATAGAVIRAHLLQAADPSATSPPG